MLLNDETMGDSEAWIGLVSRAGRQEGRRAGQPPSRRNRSTATDTGPPRPRAEFRYLRLSALAPL